MKDSTARALNALNRRFYSEIAHEFSATRERPWAGWQRITALLRSESLDTARWLVLDAGCGNGRFGHFLAQELNRPLHYIGLDFCPELLAEARRRLVNCPGIECELRECDLLENRWSESLRERCQLTAAFGIFHHVPGAAQRARLLRALASTLAPGGLLTFSLWLRHAGEHLRPKHAPWNEEPARGGDTIDPADLETGDTLLRWGRGPSLRYCHFADETEVEQLSRALAFESVDQFRADGVSGDWNHYSILRRPRDGDYGRSSSRCCDVPR